MYSEKIIPPTAPAVPPMPITEPTALRGNMSDGSVYRFADQAWCAAVARLMIATASHRLSTYCAKKIGVTATALISMVVLRAALIVQPRSIRREDSQPPRIEPRSDTT